MAKAKGDGPASQDVRSRVMSKVLRKTTIHAPAEKVFQYLEDKKHFPEFWPSMMEVSDIKDLPTGGKHFHWVYKMAGVRFEGDTDEIEYIPNKKMVGQNLKGIESKITWELEPHGKDTELTFQAEYKVPIPLVGKLAENVVAKINDNEAVAMLANLKARLEH
jgi:uncharacterized protein YndB with AHSA1/START domain